MPDHRPSRSEVDYIDTPAGLARLCERLQGQPWIAADTEFLREKTYYPLLCLIQVAVPGLSACVDPLRLERLDPLLDVLYERATLKVFHACIQDLEIFYQLRGAIPGPVFDTQIAAPLLGMNEQLGYAALVEHMLGVRLDKSHARTDWSARPLSERQIGYAADDVRYLAALYPDLRHQLESQGRLAWLDEDFRRLEEVQRFRNEPDKAWLRVRGHERLRPEALSALQLLAAWREQTARRLNRPRNWIMRDDALLDLSRLRPQTDETLAKVRSLQHGTMAKHGRELIALIREASTRPPAPGPVRPGARAKPSNEQEALADVLHGLLRTIADRFSINPAVLASRKQLLALIQGERELPLLQGWRAQMAGTELLALLEGRCSLHVGHNRLKVEPAE